MLPHADNYDELYKNFRWDIPASFNIATAACDRHADGSGQLALIYVDEDGGIRRLSFDQISDLSKRFANVLKADGLARGDRVAVFLSQSVELPIAHLAAFRSGLISVPLFTLFGEDALEFRLANSGARAVVTDASGWEKLAKIRDRPVARSTSQMAARSFSAPMPFSVMLLLEPTPTYNSLPSSLATRLLVQ